MMSFKICNYKYNKLYLINLYYVFVINKKYISELKLENINLINRFNYETSFRSFYVVECD